ncbi:hypothetical protein DRF65_01765 [Chryseobacterium pennae]|uniref:Uncharacterized protein n=1 Tax=Chryseobacterium pennae TaxID=2258962 RepID=A0A3D9CFA8_9FLAO|nr:hypothetical protein DRF65_01765 [Chryseobacterium pennae]
MERINKNFFITLNNFQCKNINIIFFKGKFSLKQYIFSSFNSLATKYVNKIDAKIIGSKVKFDTFCLKISLIEMDSSTNFPKFIIGF